MSFSIVDEEQAQEQEQKKSPSLLKEAVRHGARAASRIGEQVAGLPGDVFSLINSFVAAPITEKITGKPSEPYENTPLGKLLPTSEEHRKRTTENLGEIVKPQNNVEGFFDNIISDATALFTPGTLSKAPALFKGIWSSVIKSIGANVAKETVQDLSGDEKKGAIAHMGSLALLSFIDKKGAAQAVGEAYKPLQAKVKNLSPVSANKIKNNLNNLKKNMMKGTQAPSEKFIIDEVDKVLEKIKNGKISPEEAWAAKRSLNEKLSDVLYSISKKENQKRARKLASNISGELDDVLKQTKRQDPSFYKDLKSANRAYQTISESNLISRWVENNLKYTPLTAGLMHAFGGPIGKSAAAAVLPYEASKVLYRISKSPMLAKHYMKTLAKASAEDAPSFNRDLRILDKELQKQEKKDTFSIVED